MVNFWAILVSLKDNGEREEISLNVENTLWANTVVATSKSYIFDGIEDNQT